MERINNIHFIGVGGIGMSGIAEVMLNQGYRVTGSDISGGANSSRLIDMGANISIGHRKENLGEVDVVVVSSAIDNDNPEIIEAKKRGIPVIPRAEMLSELMRKKYGIAVSGTHGKTTTTSMIASMLDYAEVNPTYVIGGRLLQNDKNANLGDGKYFVVEADESDGSFLLFHPVIAVVTNIDNDHLGVYKNDMNNLVEAFGKFVADIPFYGVAIMCIEDEHISGMLEDVHRRVLTYGLCDKAMVYAENICQNQNGTSMRVISDKYSLDREVQIRLHGKHNALNALACICVGLELKIETEVIFNALERFEGISRRFNVYKVGLSGGRNVTAVDDYGHHPTEINSVLDSLSGIYPGKRIVFVFEPHRYSRVKGLFDAFVESLLKADYQIVLPVYAASESELQGASSADICTALRGMGAKNAHTISRTAAVTDVLDDIVEDDDIVLFMGAGSIGGIAQDFIRLGNRQAES